MPLKTMPDKFQKIISVLGYAFLALPTFTLCLFVIASTLGFPNSFFVFPGALLFVLTTMLRIFIVNRVSNKIACIVAMLFVASVVLCIIGADLVYDNSWDGQTYHQEIVMRIAKEWNPIRNLRDPVFQVMPPWFNAKGHEFIATAIYACTHNIESAKSVNAFVFIASALYALNFFKALFKNGRMATFVSIVSILNPVVLVQIPTFCVDGAVGSVSLCLLSSLGMLLLGDSSVVAIAGVVCSFILLTNLKLSAIYFLSVTYIGVLLVSLVGFRDKKQTVSLAKLLTASAVAALVVGINPYALNTWHLLRHPMTSLQLNSLSVKFIGEFAPPHFFETYNNRIMRIVASILGKTNNSSAITSGAAFEAQYPTDLVRQHPNLRPVEFGHQTVQISPPFVFAKEEIELFKRCDVRIGGFGPWFGELLILISVFSVMVFIVKRRQNISAAATLALSLSAVSLLSAIFIEHAWWARFVPQLWLFPVFLLAATLLRELDFKTTNILALSLYSLLVCDALMVAIPNCTANWQDSMVFREQLMSAKRSSDLNRTEIKIYVPSFVSLYPTVEERFKEANVPCRVTIDRPLTDDYCYRVTDLPIFCYAAHDRAEKGNIIQR